MKMWISKEGVRVVVREQPYYSVYFTTGPFTSTWISYPLEVDIEDLGG